MQPITGHNIELLDRRQGKIAVKKSNFLREK